MIYLDHNATTRPAPEVVAAMREALEHRWHNPSSIHRAGQEARRVVELARLSVAELIGARPRDITFTSGGTESIDLAIRGTFGITPHPTPPTPTQRRAIVISAVEHHAVRDVCEDLKTRGGADVRVVPVDRAGAVQLDKLAELIDDHTALVSIQWANNETGTVQPVFEIAKLCVARSVRFHCDATQWIGKMPARVGDADGALNCDLLTFSAHKIHGPKGAGVLYARSGTKLAPLIRGTQEKDRRGGTENVPGIAGLGEAARIARAWVENPREIARLAALRDRFEAAVLAANPGATVNGPPAPRSSDPHARLWNTTNIAFPRLEAEAILLSLSERGVCASAGSACSSGSLEPSPVILAMGVPPELAHGSVRFSISKETTERELEDAAKIVSECIARLRSSMPAA